MSITPRASAIIEAVASQVECTVEEVLGDSKLNRIALARSLAMLAVERFYIPKLSTVEIGIAFNRDHTSVIAATRRARGIALKYPELYDAAMTAAFEAWTNATPWSAGQPMPAVTDREANPRGFLTAAVVAPVFERGLTLVDAAKELSCTTSALYHLQKREPALRAAYREAVRRGKKQHAEHRKKFGSIWTRGDVGKAAAE